MPELALLIFPGLEKETDIEELKKVGAEKKSQKFMADYYDRRTQAIYVSSLGSALHNLTDHSPR
jgi:hypothetical protein